MKFIHTADWHLGRIFYGIKLTDDQAYTLDRLFEIIKDEKPDLLIIAGDVYDRAVPPGEAVELLDDLLSRILLVLKVPVLVLAGNHDNASRLGFGSRILKSSGLFLGCSPAGYDKPIYGEDAHGRIAVYAVPYAEPAEMRQALADETLHNHNDAMAAVISRIKQIHPENLRSILVSHAFVTGGEESESERPLSVGGAGSVDAGLFSSFHYTALGHLHKQQQINSREIRYSGSLMKYSFQETGDIKSVLCVEMDDKGVCSAHRIPLAARHDVRCIEGSFNDLLKGTSNTSSADKTLSTDNASSADDYIMATVTDQEVILDCMQRLKAVYPNLLHIRRPFFETDTAGRIRGESYRKTGEKELFTSFVSQVTGEEISSGQLDAFSHVLEKTRNRERKE